MYHNKIRRITIQIFALLSIGGFTQTAQSITAEEFLLLDNTLLLDAGVFPSKGRADIRADYGRAALRAMGVRDVFAGRMIRMGTRLGRMLNGRRIDKARFTERYLRAARMLELRREVRVLWKTPDAQPDVRVGRYFLGRRIDQNQARTDLFARFMIRDNRTMVWTLTDGRGSSIFAMSAFQVPESLSWILLMTGLLGLSFATFHKSRSRQ